MLTEPHRQRGEVNVAFVVGLTKLDEVSDLPKWRNGSIRGAVLSDRRGIKRLLDLRQREGRTGRVGGLAPRKTTCGQAEERAPFAWHRLPLSVPQRKLCRDAVITRCARTSTQRRCDILANAWSAFASTAKGPVSCGAHGGPVIGGMA